METGVRSNPDPSFRTQRWSALDGKVPVDERIAGTSGVPKEPNPEPPTPVELWARRILVSLYVVICIILGAALVILPWMPWWTENNLLFHYPALRGFAANPFVRGAFSGLGLLDIWLGIWEAVQYKETAS